MACGRCAQVYLGTDNQEGGMMITLPSVYDYSWRLDGEDEEWNRFVLREMFNDEKEE